MGKKKKWTRYIVHGISEHDQHWREVWLLQIQFWRIWGDQGGLGSDYAGNTSIAGTIDNSAAEVDMIR